MKKYVSIPFLCLLLACKEQDVPTDPAPSEPPAAAWSAKEAREHGVAAVAQVEYSEKALLQAFDAHDVEKAISVKITRPLIQVLRGWNAQLGDRQAEEARKYLDCYSAVLDFQFYSLTFADPETAASLAERDRRLTNYQSNLKGCKKQLASKETR